MTDTNATSAPIPEEKPTNTQMEPYTLWTNISYVLYGVTGLFALIGKLAGVDAVEGG